MPFTDWRRRLRRGRLGDSRGPLREMPRGTRARKNRVDADPAYTSPCKGKPHHIGVGRAQKHREVIMLVDGVDVRILTDEGETPRHLTLDPTKNHQAIGTSHVCTMS